jgi:integrase
MSVYKHARSPYWQFDFQTEGYRFSGSTGVKTSRPKAEALKVEKAERRQAERLCDDARRSNREPLRLAAAADRWWEEVGRHKKETDLRTAIDWLVETIGPNRFLHDIGNDDIAAAMAARRTHVVKAGRDDAGNQLYRPISPRTANRTVVLLLKRLMRRAFDAWDATIFQWPKWKVHLLEERKRPITELSIEDEDRLAEAGRNDYADLREFATITGLRRTECLLTWPQVDFDNAVVRLVAKGDVPRIVPLSRRAYEILWAQRGRHESAVWTYVAVRTMREPRTGRDIVKGERYPVTREGLKSIQGRIFKRAGVDKRWHDLRHTSGMRTLRATGNLKLVQKQLGHASIATTARFYADALVEDVRAGMEATAAAHEARRESRKESRTAASAGDKPLK